VSGILLFASSADDELSQQALAFAEALDAGEVDAVTVDGDYAPGAWAAALADAARERAPLAVLAPGSDRGNELLAHVGALLDLPMAANCTAVTLSEPASVTRVRWGGSLLEEARLHGSPVLATVAPHALAPRPFATLPRSLAAAPDSPVRVMERIEAESGGISLTDAPVVVSGGRGVGSAEGFAVIEELASLLGGAVGCSRAVTSAGWRPHSDQVGQTGTKISPELYIACGISGATQHMAGCKGAKKLLAINSDGEASIFANADYGVIGDLHEVLPAVATEIRKARGA
jgi:electron transfer flavoprotein alpha subunit